MPDDTTAAAPSADAAAIAIAEKYFGPATTDEPATPPQEAPPAAPAPVESKPRVSLADEIRKAREDREGTQRLQKEHATTADELAKARARIAELEATDPEKDILGWVKARKIDKDRQSLLGQALLYDLVPEKAPPDFRVKLLEAKIQRETAEREAKREQAQREELAAQAKAQLDHYHHSLAEAVRAAPPGSFPESDAWFGDDEKTRFESLAATANNIARVATSQGRAADLTPANIARVLEADIAKRLQSYSERRAAVPKAQAVTHAQEPAKQSPAPLAATTSTKGLTGGQARPPATTDQERAKRAIEVMFGNR